MQSHNSAISDIFDVALGKDEYWCMGDNRLGSFDSRGFGRVHRSLIHGRIVFRLLSFKSPNSIIYNIFLVPLYNIYLYFKSIVRPWSRWFSRIQ